MEDEFRIREKIISRLEGAGENEFGESGADSDLYRCAGKSMVGAHSDAEKSIGTVESVVGTDATAGNMERPLQYAGEPDRAVDRSREGDRADTDRVSSDTTTAGGADSDSDRDLDGELPITGWEAERELLTTALLGGGTDETQLDAVDLGFTYSDDLIDHLGIDSAYLAADVMNIVDNDSHVEDCTTMNQPPRNKKNTQSGGFNMHM